MRSVLVLMLLFGCRDARKKHDVAPAPVVQCSSGQTTTCAGSDVVDCATKQHTVCKDGCRAGTCIDTCATQGVELVYLVDDANHLLSFDPQALPGDPFHQVGTLTCDAKATPFSMAVDRRGVGWVLYNNGKLYRVSIIDARCLTAGVEPDAAPTTFGMGFAGDATGETLYVAANDDSRVLATLDTSDAPRFTKLGAIDAHQSKNPELTGTGDGKLYGYFPEPNHNFVTELDKATGAPIGTRHDLDTSIGDVEAYAFAHWGGVFYIFATSNGHTSVHAIHRKDGHYERIRDDIPYRIVGAGVSTCAPLLERAP